MPILRDGPKDRPNVSAALLADIVLKMQAAMAFVEFVGARPGEGAVGAFAFGRSRGVIEGACGAAGVPLSFLTPAHWKRLVGIPPGKEGAKDAARSEALRRWPGHAASADRVSARAGCWADRRGITLDDPRRSWGARDGWWPSHGTARVGMGAREESAPPTPRSTSPAAPIRRRPPITCSRGSSASGMTCSGTPGRRCAKRRAGPPGGPAAGRAHH
jgi:hypothetical protein